MIALLLPIATAPVTSGKIKAGPSTTAPAQNVPASRPVRGGEVAALEQKLLGAWKGGLCLGDYTFNPDGTFELRHFTPGDNTLAGAWSLRWDALPPTLLLTYKTSDFKKRAPNWPEFEFLGKTVESKILELNSDALLLHFPHDKGEWRGRRPDKE